MSKARKSKAIAEAEARIAALRSIESKLDFGKSLSIQAYIAKAAESRGQLSTLNALIAQMEGARGVFNRSERELISMSSRILKAVLVQFGQDSSEYEMAGGTRTSERKRPHRRGDTTPPVPPSNASPQVS